MADSTLWVPELGVLGTGRMGTRLAAMFARAGRRVVLGSRDFDRASALVAQLDLSTLRAGCYLDAVRAPAILPAVFIRDGLLDLLERYCSLLKSKLLIDISNPFNSDYSDFVTPWDSSGAEELQRRFQERLFRSLRPPAIRRDAKRRAGHRRQSGSEGRIPEAHRRNTLPLPRRRPAHPQPHDRAADVHHQQPWPATEQLSQDELAPADAGRRLKLSRLRPALRQAQAPSGWRARREAACRTNS